MKILFYIFFNKHRNPIRFKRIYLVVFVFFLGIFFKYLNWSGFKVWREKFPKTIVLVFLFGIWLSFMNF